MFLQSSKGSGHRSLLAHPDPPMSQGIKPIGIGQNLLVQPNLTIEGTVPVQGQGHSEASVYIAIDKSGSMKGEKMNEVCQAMRQIIEKAPNFVRFVVRSFDTDINTIVSKKKKYLDLNRLETSLKCIVGGKTSLYDAWGQMIEQIPYSASKLDLAHIIVFTDGEDNNSKKFTLNSVMELTNEKLAGNFHFTFAQAGGGDPNGIVRYVKLFGKADHCEAFNVEDSPQGVKFAFERIQKKLAVAFEMKLVPDGVGGITAQISSCNLTDAPGKRPKKDSSLQPPRKEFPINPNNPFNPVNPFNQVNPLNQVNPFNQTNPFNPWGSAHETRVFTRSAPAKPPVNPTATKPKTFRPKPETNKEKLPTADEPKSEVLPKRNKKLPGKTQYKRSAAIQPKNTNSVKTVPAKVKPKGMPTVRHPKAASGIEKGGKPETATATNSEDLQGPQQSEPTPDANGNGRGGNSQRGRGQYEIGSAAWWRDAN